jgi:hypothetical protein
VRSLEQDLSPLINQDGDAFDDRVTGERGLPVHKVGDQDEEDDEYVEEERMLQNVVCEDEVGLGAISASDTPDQHRRVVCLHHDARYESTKLTLWDRGENADASTERPSRWTG